MIESDRRTFFLGAPLAILGLDGICQTAQGQASRQAGISQDVVDYWVRHMGVPPSALPGGEDAAARVSRGASEEIGGLAREPFFFHVDNDDKVLVPAEEVDDAKLLPTGDAKVELQLARLRLNGADKAVFGRYNAGGIYIDLQQSQRNTDPANAVATSFFSALMPAVAALRSAEKSSGKTSGKSSGGSVPAPGSAAPAAAGSVQLGQTVGQSISLPGGIGHAAFSCFAKDMRKSAFGQIVAAFLSVSNNPIAAFFPILSIPLMAVTSLTPIRTMVANLQAHGDNAWILQSGQLNLAATKEGAATLAPSLRIRSGNYIAVPKSQISAMKGKLSGLKMVDGFLVPKEASALEVYDAAQEVLSEVTYLSLTTTVSRTKIAACPASA
jgi:hypothetical protein